MKNHFIQFWRFFDNWENFRFFENSRFETWPTLHSIISKVYQLYSINYFLFESSKAVVSGHQVSNWYGHPRKKNCVGKNIYFFHKSCLFWANLKQKLLFFSKSSTTNSIMIFSETNDDRKSLLSLPVCQKLRVLCFFHIFYG